MSSPPSPLDESNWQVRANHLALEGKYEQAARLYEEAISATPNVSYYWHLGVLLLLQGQEVEAQTTWLMALAEVNPTQLEQQTVELVAILDAEATRQAERADFSTAWILRQHLREMAPTHINNGLQLLGLAARMQTLTPDECRELGVIEQLKAAPPASFDSELIPQMLEQVLPCLKPDSIILELTEACLPWVSQPSALINAVLPVAMSMAYEDFQPGLAAELLELYRRLDANNVDILGHLSAFYQNAQDFEQGVQSATLLYKLSDSLADKIFANHLILRGLLSSGSHWQEATGMMERHLALLKAISTQASVALSPVQVPRLLTSTFFLPYFKDDPNTHHKLQTAVMAICQMNVQQQASNRVEQYRSRFLQPSSLHQSKQRLKIGYLSHCMGQHSVGWLARWLIKYHDREQFQINGYFINDRKNDSLFHWYTQQMEQSVVLSFEAEQDSGYLADRISEDGVSILVDLDSLTLDLTCQMLALQPAPIQVTWLGWDASGLPGVDYFIADPYVLPEQAQDYYHETLWRLPQTYIAVDGFEVGTPTLRRDQLNIPTDAVVYLSAQKGYKRHADTVRLQMKVLEQVPNSYFLIKGFSNLKLIQQFFEEIAEQEGVSCDRLRFLPEVPSESVHRANLQIADVVLDTYPYNGATTTLETLWMGVPLVTRVGEQFAARNSYTMLKNVGVEAGIAWTDEEYVEWGVRLGKDAALRQQIHWALLRSRQTSPLWNAKQFTREMERAYEQMWENR